MVRLKAYISLLSLFIFTPFQFLMVRLKEIYITNQSNHPYLISIPYSAIKRYPLLAISIEAFIFQFLMVRLKEIGDSAFGNSNFRFQFLMVRLKESLLNTTVNETFIFQFLMVRLKEHML